MRHLLGALALFGLAAPAGAADVPPPAWQGLWAGTIGTLPVRVCLSRDDEWSHAAYYYLARMQTISLDAEKDGSWSEHAAGDGKQTGRWTLSPTADGRLAGEWSAGAKTLPIALTRAGAKADQDDPCASRAFLAPRIRPVKLVTKPKKTGAFAWAEVTYEVGPGFGDVNLASFTYPATRPGDAAIIAALKLDPDKAEGEADYVGCFSGSIRSLGNDGEFDITLDPRFASPAFLTVGVHSNSFCGGAHPEYAYWWRVYDRADGSRVDFATWFKPTAVPPQERYAGSDELQLTPALRAVALKRMKIADAECADTVKDSEYWFLGLDKTGLIMTPSLPHVAAGCADDAIVPYAALAPYMTAAGKAGVARLVAGKP